MFPCPDKAPVVDTEVTPGSPGGDSAAPDTNGDLGAVSPGPPPASPASGGSLDTESVSSEETAEPGRDNEQGTSVTVSVSSKETPEPISDPGSLSPGQEASATAAEPGGGSGACGGAEGIATSLASLILSEAIAEATGTLSPEPGKAAEPAGDSAASSAEGRSPSGVPCHGLGVAEVAPQCPREPCQLGGERGQRGDSEHSAEVTDVEPQVRKTHLGKLWETAGMGEGDTHRGGMWGHQAGWGQPWDTLGIPDPGGGSGRGARSLLGAI